jgi:transposase InsO family protein
VNQEKIGFKLNQLYRFLGITKQAVFNSRKRHNQFQSELAELIEQVDLIREEHPGCGVEKMYHILKPRYLGRDKFCEIFMDLGYRVRTLKNYVRTTIPSHISYPNLIQGMELTHPFEVVQSDITYFQMNGDHYYIVFIIDVYTREVIGYEVGDNMRAEMNVRALRMAIKTIGKENEIQIHHSDRGGQYGSNIYTKELKTNGIHISMGSTAYDNAYAERINGTIKNEYLKRWKITTLKELKTALKKAVTNYNDVRKHKAFKNKFSPTEFRKSLINLNAQERPRMIIYAEGKEKLKEASSLNEFCPREEPQNHNCPIGIWNVKN